MKHHLNLRDAVEVADFMASVIEYLPEGEQATYQQVIDDIHDHKEPAPEKLVEIVRNLAVLTWPARRALEQFVQGKGAEYEWEAMMADLRPSTSLLMKRLRKNAGTSTLDETMAHPDASFAIHDEQEIEIKMLRPEVRFKLWKEFRDKLTAETQKAKHELTEMRRRLKSMAEEAMRVSRLQDELLSKVGHYEDRIFYGGEVISLEILDKEVQFEREERAIPSED